MYKNHPALCWLILWLLTFEKYICVRRRGEAHTMAEWINESFTWSSEKECLAQLAKKEICLPVILFEDSLYWNIVKYNNKKYQPPINLLCSTTKEASIISFIDMFCSCLSKTNSSFSSPVSNVCKDRSLKFKAKRRLVNWSPEIYK